MKIKTNSFSFTIVCLFSLLSLNIQAQEFMMQAWYWDYPKPANPTGSPASEPTWAKTLNSQASDLGNAGFTYLWLPPASRASFGAGSNGYDPKDLYDLGEYGLGSTGFGFRSDIDNLISNMSANGINAVADVVYNHRDGGDWEDNPAVQDYILNYPNNGGCGASQTPYPVNGKIRYTLPLGGGSLNGAGKYYFKFSSSSGNTGFNNRDYKIYAQTSAVGFQNLATLDENEPNGGGDCGEAFRALPLGIDMNAVQEVGGSCNTDEFEIDISAADFNAAGDFIEIYIEQRNGDGTGIDIRPYGLYSVARSADIISELKVQTRTDFSNMPSGQGSMNYANFQPAGTPNSGTYGTCLSGDLDFPFFFFDVEQANPATITAYQDWTKWLWNNVGFRGFRMDAVKHFEASTVSAIVNDLVANGINPGMMVGEHFTVSASVLKGWVDEVYSGLSSTAQSTVNIRVFDFDLRQGLKNACDGFGNDVRNVFQSGIVNGAGSSSFNAITFVNNHDYREAGQPIQNDPLLAYAYILTNNQIGLPNVFYPDYYGVTIPHAPTINMKTEIDELIQIHKTYIAGSTEIEYLNRFGTPRSANYIQNFASSNGTASTSLIYQISGTGTPTGKNVIVAINFSGETLKVDHEINTGFSGAPITVGTEFQDIIGNSAFPTAIVNGSNQIYMELPPRSYSVWVEGQVVLPAELTNFTAKPNRNEVHLDWETATEINVSEYQIERSLQNGRWEVIANIEANNNLAGAIYRARDKNAPHNQDLLYRLKIIDHDGTFAYSNIEKVRLNSDKINIQILPNPNSGLFNIQLNTAKTGNAEIRITNLEGREITYINQEILAGVNTHPVDISNFSKGVYFVKVIVAGKSVAVERIVKQ